MLDIKKTISHSEFGFDAQKFVVYLNFSKAHMSKDLQSTKKLILVLGMHRSGTSLVSRSLKVFGAMHGENLLTSTFGNVKGHWEDQDFFLLNEEMLGFLGKKWDLPLPVTINDVNLLVKNGYMEKAEHLLKSRFLDMDIFALKEPRITKLLPFWLKVFESISIQIYYVFALRKPMSVAYSLHKRRNIPLEQGLLLWYSYNAYAIKNLEHKKVLFIDYDSFLNSAPIYLEKMSAFLNLDIFDEEAKIFLDSFLDKNLRNFGNDMAHNNVKEEKHYNMVYKQLLKNMSKQYVTPEFIEQISQNIMFQTLEQLVKVK